MQKDELLALAERVEALNGPDMEIFYKVRDALWPYDPATPIEDQLPALLARQQFDRFVHGGAWLDASMTLVPEGWNWMAGERDQGRPRAYVNNGKRLTIRSGLRNGLRSNPEAIWCEVVAATPALALCAAALRALAWGE